MEGEIGSIESSALKPKPKIENISQSDTGESINRAVAAASSAVAETPTEIAKATGEGASDVGTSIVEGFREGLTKEQSGEAPSQPSVPSESISSSE